MARAIDAGILQDNLIDIYGDCYRLVYLKDVLDLIDEQPALTPPVEWVSVKERLPELGERVLFTEGVFVCEGYVSQYNNWFRSNGMKWDMFRTEVTHWMPLPAPPDRRPPEGEADA